MSRGGRHETPYYWPAEVTPRVIAYVWRYVLPIRRYLRPRRALRGKRRWPSRALATAIIIRISSHQNRNAGASINNAMMPQSFA